MQLKMLAVFCAVAALGASPAFAQAAAAPHAAPSSTPAATNDASNIGQTLQQDLQKAGFSDIKVSPEAYIVHAKDSHGNPVLMRVGPDTVTEFTELPAGGKPAAPGASSTSSASK